MTKQTMQLSACALAAVVFALTGCKSSTEAGSAASKQPIRIVSQPQDQYVPMGAAVTFSVTARQTSRGEKFPITYQWLRNCHPLASQTDSTLTIKNVTTNDVGFYVCAVNTETKFILTQPATLMAYATNVGGPITVWSVPPPSSGSSSGSTCPAPYIGYHSFTKPTAPFGWTPNAATPHTATDITRTDTKVKFFGSTFGNNGCGVGGVTVTPLNSTSYRFTVYFPSGVPTTAYPLQLNGFNP